MNLPDSCADVAVLSQRYSHDVQRLACNCAEVGPMCAYELGWRAACCAKLVGNRGVGNKHLDEQGIVTEKQ